MKRPFKSLRRSAAESGFRDLLRAAGVAMLGRLTVVSVAGAGSAWLPQLETFADLQGYFAVAGGVIAVLTLAARSRALAVTAAAILLINVAAIAVRVAPLATCPVQMAATGQLPLKVLTHNVLWTNHDLAAVERLLVEKQPDVIVLQEVQSFHRPLIARMKARYPFQAICKNIEHCGTVVMSRYPIDDWGTVDDAGGGVIAMKAELSVEGRALNLLSAHLVRPFRGTQQAAQFKALARAASALPPNTLVAGDFNSVVWSANLARYASGSGMCASNATHATWPQWLGPLGMPIDHIFLKPGLRPLSIATLDGSGSDHKALLATVGLQ